MAEHPLDRLCDLASAAMGKHHVKGSPTNVANIHSKILGAIRGVALGKIDCKEASRLARVLGAELSKAR
jgi:hypothetical protein